MEEVRIGIFKRSWLFTKGAWQALKLDREMLLLPILGTIVGFTVLLGLIMLGMYNLAFFTNLKPGASVESVELTAPGYALIIAFYLVTTLVSMFVAGAVTHAALERFRGKDPSIKTSLRAARERIKPLGLFGLLSFGIGYLLSEIAERIPFVGGRVITWLAGFAWRIASFFAIPVIMDTQGHIGPVEAVKDSARTIKKTWGESLILTAGVGIVAFLLVIAYGITGVLTVVAVGSLTAGLTAIPVVILGVLVLLGMFILIIAINTLESYIKAAIYYYSVTGESPAMFDKRLLKQAFTPKKARKVFNI